MENFDDVVTEGPENKTEMEVTSPSTSTVIGPHTGPVLTEIRHGSDQEQDQSRGPDLPAPSETQTQFIARTPKEMQASQKGLTDWFKTKVLEERLELSEMQEIVNVAVKNRWRSKPAKARVKKMEKRVLFYEKCLSAIELGYCLIPNFPVDVFMVRTDREKPPVAIHRYRTPNIEPRVLPAGDGNYVGTEAKERRLFKDAKNYKGEVESLPHHQAIEFDDPEFPMVAAMPAVMNATGRAAIEKVFDQIGICPEGSVRSRGCGDPIIVGQVLEKSSRYSVMMMSFLIAWCVDVRTL